MDYRYLESRDSILPVFVPLLGAWCLVLVWTVMLRNEKKIKLGEPLTLSVCSTFSVYPLYTVPHK